MFYQIFPSPQVKRWTIITWKHGIYELPHDFPNHLRLFKTEDLRKLGNKRKVAKPHKKIAQCPVPLPKSKFCKYQQKTLLKQKLNFPGCAPFHIKSRVSLKYFVSYCRKVWPFWSGGLYKLKHYRYLFLMENSNEIASEHFKYPSGYSLLNSGDIVVKIKHKSITQFVSIFTKHSKTKIKCHFYHGCLVLLFMKFVS